MAHGQGHGGYFRDPGCGVAIWPLSLAFRRVPNLSAMARATPRCSDVIILMGGEAGAWQVGSGCAVPTAVVTVVVSVQDVIVVFDRIRENSVGIARPMRR